jgi:single-stranded-DNA-specific exonuclease
MMEQWYLYKKKADFTRIGEKFQIDPVIARLIRNRDVTGDEEIHKYLYGNLSDISDPFLMKGVREGVNIIKEKIRDGKTIRIISDYDVDGVVSNYILWKAIHDLGGKIDFQIPDRMKDGYGINENIIEKAVEDQIDTILTCDNGIAAFDAVAYGKEHGLTMIITDHHDVPFAMNEDGSKKEILPPADVVINPKQKECHYPYSLLCGAGVAFQFVRALYQDMGEDKDRLEELLSMLAIATVCDVVDLTGENRIFVKEGLKRIKETKNVGLRALLEVHDLMEKQIQSYALGFIIGPCINASGRLESAEKALNLFLEEDEQKALQTAKELKELNDLRKSMTENGVKMALDQAFEYEAKGDKVLVLYLPDCHESIAGIIAGRIKDRLNHPVFVLTDAKDGIKGSGRSIEGYSMFEEMMKVKEVFTKFGGHPMAAGCSLEKKDLEIFRKKINENCTLDQKDFAKKVQIDIDMPVDYITMDLIQQLSVLEPFGKENKKPLFAHRKLRIERVNVFGKNKNVIKLALKSSQGTRIDGMIFEDETEFREKMGTSKYITCTYYPVINEYQGYKSLQINIQNYFFAEE